MAIEVIVNREHISPVGLQYYGKRDESYKFDDRSAGFQQSLNNTNFGNGRDIYSYYGLRYLCVSRGFNSN